MEQKPQLYFCPWYALQKLSPTLVSTPCHVILYPNRQFKTNRGPGNVCIYTGTHTKNGESAPRICKAPTAWREAACTKGKEDPSKSTRCRCIYCIIPSKTVYTPQLTSSSRNDSSYELVTNIQK